MKKIKSMLLGALLGSYSLTPLYAFQPSQAPVLSAAAVTPNVLLLVDNSGSMNNAVLPAAAVLTNYNSVAYKGDNGYAYVEPSSNYPFGFWRDGCSNNYIALYRVQNNFVQNRRCYRLPDPVGSGNTRYTGQYLSYIYNTYTSGGDSGNDLRTVLPNDYRMNVARKVTKSIVSNNRALRFGMFAFNPSTRECSYNHCWGDAGPGGSLKREVANLSVTRSPTGGLMALRI